MKKRVNVTIYRASGTETFFGVVIGESDTFYLVETLVQGVGEWFAKESRMVNCKLLDAKIPTFAPVTPIVG